MLLVALVLQRLRAEDDPAADGRHAAVSRLRHARWLQPVSARRPRWRGTPTAWQWLQAGDARAAERSFAAALKAAPDFYPAEAGLGYVALARKDARGRAPALRSRGGRQPALRAGAGRPRRRAAGTGRARRGADELRGGASPPTRRSQRCESRIDVLRFRGMQDEVAAARKAAESGRSSEARAGITSGRSPLRRRVRSSIASWPPSSGRTTISTPRSSTRRRRRRSTRRTPGPWC